jgi:uncharacterized protein (DUF4415 family)
VIDYFRSSGRGWQTRIGAVLAGHVTASKMIQPY